MGPRAQQAMGSGKEHRGAQGQRSVQVRHAGYSSDSPGLSPLTSPRRGRAGGDRQGGGGGGEMAGDLSPRDQSPGTKKVVKKSAAKKTAMK